MSLTLEELLEQNIINNVNVKLGHMEVLLSNESGEEITYLYKLKDGKASSSFGIKYVYLRSILNANTIIDAHLFVVSLIQL